MLAPALGQRAGVDRVEADLVDQLGDDSLRLLVVAGERDAEPVCSASRAAASSQSSSANLLPQMRNRMIQEEARTERKGFRVGGGSGTGELAWLQRGGR
jgi:hypothetical protein